MDLSLNGFDNASLTVAINEAPYMKGVLLQQKVFTEEPVNSTTIVIEQVDSVLSLVPHTPRGAPPDVHPKSTRKLVTFEAPHLVTRDTMLADSWQNVRGMGESAPADPTKERNRVLAEMRRRLELTLERHKASALNGIVLDANGDVLFDVFAGFGVTQQVVDFELDNTATNTTTKIMDAKRAAQAALDVPVQKYLGFASPQFLDALREHGSTGYTRAGWEAAADLSAGAPVFTHGGVEWHEVAPVAGVDFLPAGAAFLVPMVPKLCMAYFAPADYLESVNSEGLPFYAKAEPLPFNRGVQIEAQTNPCCVVTRPRAVIRCEA